MGRVYYEASSMGNTNPEDLHQELRPQYLVQAWDVLKNLKN